MTEITLYLIFIIITINRIKFIVTTDQYKKFKTFIIIVINFLFIKNVKFFFFYFFFFFLFFFFFYSNILRNKINI